MDSISVSLLVAGTLLLIGFAAALAFHRFRIPDFIVLLLLGAGLSVIPFQPFGPNLLNSLRPLLPLFTQLTIAFILFEGGLSLRLRESSGSLPAILAHSVGAMTATAVLTWAVLFYAFGLSNATALVVAIAFAGPSASVALSFASRMHISAQAESAIILEGVLTNVIAVVGVLVVLAWYTNPANFLFLPYLGQVLISALLGAVLGLVWGRVVTRLAEQRFIYIATIALAIVVYALAQGFLAQNGAVAVFVLGIALGRERSARAAKRTSAKITRVIPAEEDLLQELTQFVEATSGVAAGIPGGSKPTQGLRSFQSEITFALRTFFFVYLGLLLVQEWQGLGTIVAALLVVATFVLGRLPTSGLLGWGLAWYPRDTRAVFANMARGMTDVVLVLYAAQSGILPQTDVHYVLGIIPMVVLIAAFVAAGLVIWAGWSPGEAETKKIIQKDEAAAHPHKPLGPQPPLKQDGVPAPFHQPEPRAPGSPPNGGVPGEEALHTLGSPRSRDPRGRP